MKSLLLYLVSLAVLAASLTGCGGHTPEDVNNSLDTAEAYLADGDLDDALRTADAVYSADSAVMSAGQLGRLALVYMRLADRTDEFTAVGHAIHCYRMAWRVNPDSAAAFFTHLPVDIDAYAITLSEIVRRLDAPRNLPPDEEAADSLDLTHFHPEPTE